MGIFATVGQFLVEHYDLVELAIEAITKGVSKDTLMNAIKKEMVAASDAEMKRELDL